MAQPTFDILAAHKHFAASCFNEAWALIDKTDRTEADQQRVLAAAHASLYHWMHRPDATDRHRSIGCWQIARVHAILGEGAPALRWGRASLAYAADAPPFYAGYAHEAIARAAMCDNDARLAGEHLDLARGLLERIEDQADRDVLAKDLDTIDLSTGNARTGCSS